MSFIFCEEKNARKFAAGGEAQGQIPRVEELSR
jgi:hypothetical protein